MSGLEFRQEKARADLKAAGVPGNTPVFLEPTAWGEDDREWFEAHPKRSHRVRRVFPGERFARALTEDEVAEVVAVRQIEPGWRARSPLVIAGISECLFETMVDLIGRGFREEGAAHVLFDLSTKGRLVLQAELKAMIADYEGTTGVTQ